MSTRKAAQKCMKKMLHQSIAGEKLDKELEKQMGTSPYKLTKKGTPRVEFYGASTKKEIQDEDYSEDEEDDEDDEEDNSDEESESEEDEDYEESDDSSDEESDEETSDEEDSDEE